MEIKLDLPDIEELEQEQPEAAEQVAKQVQPVPEEAPVAAPDPEQQEAPKPGSQTPDWLKPFRAPLPGEDRSGLMTTVMDTLAAPGAGLNDYVVDELNKLPFVNMRKQSEYSNEGVQAVRELSSIIGPFIALRKAAMKGGAKLQAKVKHPLGEKRLMKWFSELGIDTGVGAYVDYTNTINQYDDNMTGWLKRNWPKFWSFLPDDWATLDSDSPAVHRAKNIKEGARFGLFGSLLESTIKLGRALKGLSNTTSFVFESESAAKKFAPKVEPTDPMDVAEGMAASSQKYEEALNEMGELNLSKNPAPDAPVKGVHDGSMTFR